MKKAKWLALLLAAFALSACFSALTGGATAEPSVPAETEDEREVERVTVEVERDMEHPTVANPTQMEGFFFTSQWDNNTADIDVRALLDGYNLIEFDWDDGSYRVDPSVGSGVAVTENQAGDRSYLLVLYHDLYFSDGSPITAWDYAFSLLFSIDQRINDLDGDADCRDYLLGCQEYLLRTAELKRTQLVRRDGLLAEQVLEVRLEDSPEGEARYAGPAEVMGESEGLTLYRNDVNELTLAPEDDAARLRPVHVDAQGFITDWHYENGVRVFSDGSHGVLSGVRVLSDDMLMITVDHEYLPYFYQMGMLYCAPYRASAVLPGVEVRDDGLGAYLANAEEQPRPLEDADAPVFSVENLREALLDPENGYLRHPTLSSGPYTLLSFDGVTAEFELNPWYKGNSKGETATIPRLTYTLAENETAVEKLATGVFDVLNKMTRADVISQCLELMINSSYLTVEEDEEKILETEYVSRNGYGMTTYPRIGLSYISFCCERDTVCSQAVRQAIAYSLDRDQLTMDYTGGNGIRVDGYYGLGQWMLSVVQGFVSYPVPPPEDENDVEAWQVYDEEFAAWEELSLDTLTAYTLDLDEARRLLDADGWELNEDGIREKDGVQLALTMIYPETNEMAESFQEWLVPNLEAVGIQLNLVPVPNGALQRMFYRQIPDEEDALEMEKLGLIDAEGVRQFDMIYMATNFEVVFDPSAQFSLVDGVYEWKSTGYADQELFDLAWDMSHTEEGHTLEYMQRWIAFQERFNETLPMLPIYSNVYFDFNIAELQGYDVDENVTWSQAIVGSALVPMEETKVVPGEEGSGEEELEESFDDDELIIID